MQVRAGGKAGAADITDHIPTAHRIAHLVVSKRGHVRIHGGDLAAMVEDDMVTKSSRAAQPQQDDPIHSGIDGCAAFRGKVNSGVDRIGGIIARPKFAGNAGVGADGHGGVSAKKVPLFFQRPKSLADGIVGPSARERTGRSAGNTSQRQFRRLAEEQLRVIGHLHAFEELTVIL